MERRELLMDPLKIILSIMLVTWAGIGVGYIDILIQRRKKKRENAGKEDMHGGA